MSVGQYRKLLVQIIIELYEDKLVVYSILSFRFVIANIYNNSVYIFKKPIPLLSTTEVARSILNPNSGHALACKHDSET